MHIAFKGVGHEVSATTGLELLSLCFILNAYVKQMRGRTVGPWAEMTWQNREDTWGMPVNLTLLHS